MIPDVPHAVICSMDMFGPYVPMLQVSLQLDKPMLNRVLRWLRDKAAAGS